MEWETEYSSKLMTADDAIDRFIKDGYNLYTSGLHVPTLLILTLLDRVKTGKLTGIDTWGNWMNGHIPLGDVHATADQFRYHTYFAGPNERAGMVAHNTAHVPVHFSDVEAMAKDCNLDYALVSVTPPDEEGYVNIGPVGFTSACLPHCKHIIAQVNANLPYVSEEHPGSHRYHISDFDAFVLGDEELEDLPPRPVKPEEEKCAEFILDRINDGDCVQIGIGGTSDAIGHGLFTKKHLGTYTEMYSDILAQLQEAGVIDNSRNNYRPGVSVCGYSTGAKHLYDYIDHNPDVLFASYSKVCDPRHIAMNDNLVSVNTAISIDLFGQICAESIGPRQYSASGGQMNFVQGAKWSKGGRSFIAVTSVAHTKQGPVSRIVPTLTAGSAVTTLRNDVQYVVTEYGVADLRWADIPTRARRLIDIAHPDFRDKLEFDAKKMGILY
ncbi:MAG: acetyl-CoA hydrolase/transferase family protein [Eggerthellaceae bacterium]|jgi:4-hydroxybutyrate CoA-transferase